MKKIIKNNSALIIGIILLTVIIILSFLTLKLYQSTKYTDKVVIPNGVIDDTSTSPSTSKEPYKKTFPKLAQADDRYNYVQFVEGDGDINLCQAIATPLGTYIIATTNCANGDIESDHNGIGIVLYDNVGTIKSSYNLPTKYDTEYISYALTDSGIMIITSNKYSSHYNINLVDYSLKGSYTLNVNKGLVINVLPTSQAFLLVVEYPTNNIVYKYSNGNFLIKNINKGSYISGYELNNEYLIFLSNESSYCGIKLSDNLSSTSQITIANARLTATVPIVENGKQKFVFIEKTIETVLRKVNASFDVETTVNLGAVDVLSILPSHDEIILLCSGQLNGFVHINSNLDCSFKLSSHDSDITEVFRTIYANNIYYMLARNANNDLLLLKNSLSTITTIQISTATTKANLTLLANNTLNIIYGLRQNDYNAIKIVSLGA